MPSIARKNLFHDRTRFAITLIGITFSVVLIFTTIGVYLGFMQDASFIMESIPADIWITSKNLQNFNFAWPISERKLDQVKEVKGVAEVEKMIHSWGVMKLFSGGTEQVEILGLDPEGPLGFPWPLAEGQPTDVKGGEFVIVDQSSVKRLGRLKVGDVREINDYRVKVVGLTRGLKSITTAPYVITSYDTAALFNPYFREPVFILVKTVPGQSVEEVAQRIREHVKDVDVYTQAGLSAKTRWYWTVATGMGMGFLLTAFVGFVVGMVVVSQTIYSSTIEHIREFGTLKAIGATNWTIYKIILEQAAVNAVIGFIVGLGLVLLIKKGYDALGIAMLIPPPLMGVVSVLTLAMCLSASIISIRKVRTLDPVMVFRV
ncbi:MAG: ABC transporter permease [Nitrospirae bacterium]|nr:ABC transporter permease [Nitrospirota bacterium]